MKLTPFFITNDAWYTYDDENEMWVLTDKAPLEAVKSYEEYYAEDDVRLEGLEELRENPEKALAEFDETCKRLREIYGE